MQGCSKEIGHAGSIKWSNGFGLRFREFNGFRVSTVLA